MKKRTKKMLVVCIAFSMVLTACGSSKLTKDDPQKTSISSSTGVKDATTSKESQKPDASKKPPIEIDYKTVKPNEAGKVMVVMFHSFVETFTPKSYDDGSYATTFESFEKLLPVIYDKGYRLVSIKDFINNQIDVAPGCMPMVFTMDDASSGQFNLVEKDGKLEVNENTAVGILEKFNKIHPDFGMKGTFYVNLGDTQFDGKGTLAERLKKLIDMGFDIGNHTYTHINLLETESSEKIVTEIGKNNKTMQELVPGYIMETFSLPFGAPSKDLQSFVVKGEFEGVKYDNKAIMEVGWDPTINPVNPKFNALSIHRIRASGIKPVDADLAWWFKNISRDQQYISDGNPDMISVPAAKEGEVDKNRLNGKKLNLY